MGARHRRGSRRAARITRIGVATATATAMAVSVAPPQAPQKPEVYQNVDLAAAIKLLPNHDQVPDITGGLGTTIYDASQTLADQLARALVNGVSLAAFAQAAGVDPQSIVNTLLADIPSNLLPGILTALALDLPVLQPLLDTLGTGAVTDLLTQVLGLLNISEISDGTLTGLLALIGLNLSDPLNLSGLAVPGLNVVTAGPTFTALKLLGLDLGWVPSLPNSVAAEINGSEYLKVGVTGLLNTVVDNYVANLPQPLDIPGQLLANTLRGLLNNPLLAGLPDLIDVRAVPTVGIGLGAFAAAMAYDKVIADLKNQPGGSAYATIPGNVNPLLGSLTILPMILINNPARPDGGAFARFGALAALFGINTVNPTTQATNENGTIPVLGSGLSLGGANVLPILVDATYEYQPLSDLASWPNAVTLFNNLAAGLSPTYLLRGLSLDGIADDVLGQATAAGLNALGGNPLALNIYLTLHSKTLPALEPLYLASDFLNLVGLAPLAQIPMRIANALAPALRILTDVGYSNVVRNADGTYERDFSNAGTETPFLSFPNLDPGLVLGDTINALFGGIQKELGPNPTPNTPNVLANLLNAILGGGLGGVLGTGTTVTPGAGATTNPFGALGDLLNGVLGGLGLGGLLGGVTPLATTPTASLLSVTDVPSTNARMTTLLATVDQDPSDSSSIAGKSGVKIEEPSTATELAPAGSTPSAEDVAAAAAAAKAEAEKVAAQAAADKAAADKAAAEKAAAEKAAADKEAADKAAAADDVKAPKHAKDDAEEPSTPAIDSTPKHAKPEQNVVRESPNFSPDAPKANDTVSAGKDPVTPASPVAPAAPEKESEPSAAAAA